ncbi:hypothetical protein DFH28DRAFT_1084842 [Melampsora americana]|nr:hypothetical protein DFH28DRAFT_1084842 [Melampsora americana]
MNPDTLFNFGGQFDCQGSQDLGDGLNTPSPGGSIQALNHHQTLRNASNGSVDLSRGRGDSMENSRRSQFQQTPHGQTNAGRFDPHRQRRDRDGRSMSPEGRVSGQRGAREWQPRGTPNPRECRDSADATHPRGAWSNDNEANGGAIFSSPLPVPTLLTFQAMATQCCLEGPFQTFAMGQAEVFGDNNRHLAQVTSISKLLMEVARLTRLALPPTLPRASTAGASPGLEPGYPSTPTPKKKWSASEKLIGLINPLALKLLFSPLLESYTSVGNGPEGVLPNSLFNSIKRKVNREGPAFTAEHLPPQTLGVEEAANSQALASTIRDAGKHAREKLHNVLLIGIHDQKTKENVDCAVPGIKSMVQRVAVKCGLASVNAEVEAIWATTDLPTRARLAYLRREAARLVIKGGKGCESIWAVVDKRLAEVRMKKDEAYTTAFYQIIFDEDCHYFDGKLWFRDLKARIPKVTLDMPSEAAVMARMARAAEITSQPGSNESTSLNPAN